MTGLRLGYVVTPNRVILDRMQKVVLYTANGVNSIAQWGGVAALTGPQDARREFQPSTRRGATCSMTGLQDIPVFTGAPPGGAFYAFLRIADGWTAPDGRRDSWAMTEYLLTARVGSSPGIIFGPAGEGYLRFSTACQRDDLTGALAAMRALFG